MWPIFVFFRIFFLGIRGPTHGVGDFVPECPFEKFMNCTLLGIQGLPRPLSAALDKGDAICKFPAKACFWGGSSPFRVVRLMRDVRHVEDFEVGGVRSTGCIPKV